ncbi:beta-lactamase [Talaromyces proteolyticus]|uniref:Beta-lactamase n=1 Tax=Talaromyces proteolyticus TaxID=1131652 RepID=A0AAD4KU83_9EURO|nr:beta-lactamase [Talaromyces proteolyticus]KAH8700977.1 beta-lactamase [Talaromyces proteolyticus]
MDVHGHCDPKFDRVRQLLQRNISSGEEIGASICVNVAGTNVLDIWGGFKDANCSQPWEEDTLVLVWSTTKCLTNFAALILVDRGLLDPYEKVATYWPEFAANGKENVEVRHFMSHNAGLPAWEEPITLEELYDISKGAAILAQQKPWWTPGTASGYHAITQGHLIGELVKRITGKSLRQFIEEEITGPLNADFHIGAPQEDWGRIAELYIPPQTPLHNTQSQLDPESIAARALATQYFKDGATTTAEFRNAELGACNGFANARSVARSLCPISMGGTVDGKTFLSPKTLNMIFYEQSHVKDLVLLNHIRWGIGFALPSKLSSKPWIPQGRVCYWGGYGGSIIIMDLDRKLTIAYAMNKLGFGTQGTARTEEYVTAICKAIDS